MSKSRAALSYIFLLIIVFCLYYLVVVQPSWCEDFNVFYQARGLPGILFDPRYGRGFGRFIGNALAYGLVWDPLRFIQPGQWIVLFGFALWIWNLTQKEPLPLRFALVVLLSIGFPYFGPAVIFKAAAPIHGLVSMIGVIAFTVLVSRTSDTWRSRSLFVMLYLMSIFGLETWLFFFAGVWLSWALHIAMNAVWKRADIFAGVCSRFYFGLLGFGTVIAFYLRWITLAGGGPESYHPVMKLGVFTYAIARTCLLVASVQLEVLPIALCMAYLARRGNLPEREGVWRHAAVGACIAIFGVSMFLLVTDIPEVANFRTRFSFAVLETLVFIYLPWDHISNWLANAFGRRTMALCRPFVLPLAVVIFCQNIFFTFIHNGVHVSEWLDYRHRVLTHDTSVIGVYSNFGMKYSRYYIISPSKYSLYAKMYWEKKPGLIPYIRN